MDNSRLRAILLNLQDRLSNDDRKRLHFYLGNDVPRRIRDDPSLNGTLSLLDSLFDQDKINEEDFTYLINAFQQIQCINHNRKKGLNESMQSLSLIMPPILDQLLNDEVVDDQLAIQTYQNVSNSKTNFNENHPSLIVENESNLFSIEQKR
ncbi:hypothetical protein I4U23_004064 [Adineta vaga]|nr:hypothetical protein I4U23_004064 [Adineta vaga]